MTVLSARGLRRRYGMREVLRDASLAIEARERVGMVGRNGSGKTTLARILAGAEEPDAGEVVRRSGLRVGYLAQEPRLEPGLSAVASVLAGLQPWQAAIERHALVSAKIERGEGTLEALLAAQADAVAKVEELGGWDKRHEAETILAHVGIDDLDASVESMSGGEQRRVALARVLVSAPDVAILDEPTNHLDIEAVEWLEDWLGEQFRGALLLVTHDRYLLDRVVTRTVEIEGGEVYSYEGGWARYLAAKAEREAHAERTEANRRNYLRRELEWLRRSPQARTTKQKARVDRIEAVADEPALRAARRARIEMEHVRSGRTILEAEDIAVDVGERRLLAGLTLRLREGERVGIVGPNGCGKTSLLRVLTGALAPSQGTVRHGKNTCIEVLDQDRSGLVDALTVFENVAEGRTHVEIGGQSLEVRSYLERFLFDVHEQRHLVSTLSGGERARVALARALREGANVVVLDEPTNDLDVTTLAALEESLLAYTGTVLFVTHDRFFLDRVATSVLAFEDGRVTQYAGGYSDYLDARPRAVAPVAAPVATPAPSASVRTPRSGLTFAERRELEQLIDRVDAAERRVGELESELASADFYARSEGDRRTFFATLQEARGEVERLTERWSELESRR